MRRKPTPLPVHPAMKLEDRERKNFATWLYYRRKIGLPDACYGIYKVTARDNQLWSLKYNHENNKGKIAHNRKRPLWCSCCTWKNWQAYRREMHAGIPLEDYIDPVKRKAWRKKALLREITPAEARQAAVELLKRKGLAPR